MQNFNLINEAIEAINAGCGEKAIERLKQFTYLNMPRAKSAGKVKIYDWTSLKEPHPFCKGVYHDADARCAVATDTHVMLVSKSDFNAEFGGKIISKKGEVINCNYPKYARVIPDASKMQEVSINREQIIEKLAAAKAELKTMNKVWKEAAVSIGGEAFEFFLPSRFVKHLLSLSNEGRFYYRGDNSPMLYKSDDEDYTAVLMPILRDKAIVEHDGYFVY